MPTNDVLPKYDPNRKCTKCGYAATTIMTTVVTRIKRTCGRCGWIWHERTLDDD